MPHHEGRLHPSELTCRLLYACAMKVFMVFAINAFAIWTSNAYFYIKIVVIICHINCKALL